MSAPLTLALAQMNPTVGDIAGNAAKILDLYRQASAQHADMMICPELALTGYPPEDLVLMPAFRRQAMDALHALAKQTGRASLVTGSVWEEDDKAYNAAVVMQQGKIVHVQPKMRLPNYGVFDEKRVFIWGEKQSPVKLHGINVGFLVCEDVWVPELSASLKEKDVELVIVINASPFESGKMALRKQIVAESVKQAGAPVVYVNMVGGQDDIVFDGGSFIMSKDGRVDVQLPEFFETLSIVRADGKSEASGRQHTLLGEEGALWHAMMLGLRDYVRKNGFTDVVLGLSGGIDSALTAAVAADALGAAHVKGVLLPSPYTSHDSMDDAHALAKNLGIETLTIPITEAMQIFEERLSPVFRDSGWMEDVSVGGNLQARLRGITLMALSNRNGWMLLSTGNKSEIAVGYSTLYGDSCGSYNVLKDVYKTLVYTLARWRNAQSAVIPLRSLTKAPTAELKPGQTDQDQLPPYDILDAILLRHIEGQKSAEEIIVEGYEKAVVEKVIRMVRNSEYKRRQSCPGVKLSPMLFGKDRRYPLTNKF